MFYDLNIPWSSNQVELQRTLTFLRELDYNVVALNYTLAGKLPTDLTSPIPAILPFSIPSGLHVITRCTLILTDAAQNHRLSTLAANYDILAVRPMSEKILQQACLNLDCDIISLDLSQRLPFHFKFKTLSAAVARGIKFEICYAAGVLNTDGGASRRNLIANATNLIRVSRGRGLIISSEAKRALACRGPWDVINLAAVWGLGQEKGREGVGREARAVVVQAQMKRTSFRGVIDIVDGGEKPEWPKKGASKAQQPEKGQNAKRKAEVLELRPADNNSENKPVSKRELKRRAKKAKLEGQPNAEKAIPEDTAEKQPNGASG